MPLESGRVPILNRRAKERYKQRKYFNRFNLIQLLDWSTISKTDDRIKVYKIRLFYEYFNEDLRSEVELRRNKNLKFTNEEMTMLAYQMIETLAEMEKEGLNHGEISSKFIFDSGEGRFRLCEMMNHRSRYPNNIIKKWADQSQL